MKEEGSKVAIVTAGGSGIGAGAACKLAADGFQIAVLSSSGKGEALAKELGGIGVTGSNQSKNDLQMLVNQIMAQWGRIDVLVNSAGPRSARCGARDHGRRLASWPGNVFSKRGTAHTPSHPHHAKTKIRIDHQYLNIRGVRARRGLSHIRRIPGGTCRIHQTFR